MYYEILKSESYELLKKICEINELKNFYMVGGTSLSLQLKLRDSFDFDFCTKEIFNNEILLEKLKDTGNVEILQNYEGTLDLIINGVQVSFFYFPNKRIGELVDTDMENLKLGSVLDICLMKIVAIGGRGSKKDFFDLYNIMKIKKYPLDLIAKSLAQKYGKKVNYLNMIMGLSYFEDAEKEILPKVYVDYDWKEIKKYFIKFQDEFERELEKVLNN